MAEQLHTTVVFGENIAVTVTETEDGIKEWINGFPDDGAGRIIGFDIGPFRNNQGVQAGTVIFSDAKRCLIVRFLGQISRTLNRFLSDARNRFVGVNIHTKMERIPSGAIKNRNTPRFFDISDYSATFFKKPAMINWGLRNLVPWVSTTYTLGFSFSYQTIPIADWDKSPLSEDLIDYAALKSVACYKICDWIGGLVVPKKKPSCIDIIPVKSHFICLSGSSVVNVVSTKRHSIMEWFLKRARLEKPARVALDIFVPGPAFSELSSKRKYVFQFGLADVCLLFKLSTREVDLPRPLMELLSTKEKDTFFGIGIEDKLTWLTDRFNIDITAASYCDLNQLAVQHYTQPILEQSTASELCDFILRREVHETVWNQIDLRSAAIKLNALHSLVAELRG